MEELKRDAEMRDFFEDLGKEKGPIDPVIKCKLKITIFEL
jgi:hypothetical protein